MRKIDKPEEEAKLFSEFTSKRFRSNRWDEFTGSNEYRLLRNHLLFELQKGLSAYTERPIALSRCTLHIDHFRKKGFPEFKKLTFDYYNLFVDERDSRFGAVYKDGSAHVNYDTFEGRFRIFDPARDNMADFIIFDRNGEMYPKDGLDPDIEERVKETIRVFNLNFRTLKDERRDTAAIIDSYVQGQMTEEEIRKCIAYRGMPTFVDWYLSALSKINPQ